VPLPDTANADTGSGDDVPLLQMSGIVKEFPGIRALTDVHLDVVPGEVHCLLGQNGAGKSTLIKVLSGALQPEQGSMRWEGEVVRFSSPVAALKRGIAAIYQELDLVDGLSVAENIFLGHEPTVAGLSSRGTANERAARLLARLGHPEIRPSREVGSLAAAAKQIVSMGRALSRNARLIIMDEPSAVLDSEEVNNLFRVIGELKAQNVAVVYISHRLEEIRRIGDRVTVLKDGRTVATGLSAKQTPTAEVITLMTGRSIEYVFPTRPGVSPDAPEVLVVTGLTRKGEFNDVNMTVRAGEVVGLAGLVGSGRSEILETISGARRATRGSVTVQGRELRPGSVVSAVGAGLGLAPEERKSQALLLDESIADNITLSTMGRFSRLGFTRRRAAIEASRQQGEALDIRPAGVRRSVRTLSGGNQQKVVLGRWLLTDCRVLLLDEPTRGVDIGARSEIYKLVRELADAGLAVVVVSSEIEEVLGLSDRVLVMREGVVVHSGASHELDEAKVLNMVMEGGAA
jgi:ribose transport system ATP-binding protein